MKNKNTIDEEINISNKFWIVLLIALLFFLYFIPKEIAYPKYKILDWILLILILILLPYLVFKTLESINYKTYPTKLIGICALSILIVGPTVGIFQNYRKEKELNEKGKITECYVFDKKKSKNDWLINCKYVVNNSEYITYYETDEKNTSKIGDTLKIIYNKEFPRMYKIVFEEGK